jgi:hypothetical protein
MIARYRRFCQRFGLNYLWGLLHYAAGVASGSFLTGFMVGLFH